MSRYIPFLDDPIPGRIPGGIEQTEKWWVERQEALERAGYLLRSRYRPGWEPSWAGTNKFYLRFEDGRGVGVGEKISFPGLPIPMILASSRHGCNSYF